MKGILLGSIIALASLSAFGPDDKKEEAKKKLDELSSKVTSSRAVETSIVVNAPQQEVFNKVSTAAGLKTWLCNDSKVSDIVGGQNTLTFNMGDKEFVAAFSTIKNKPPTEYSLQWEGSFDPVSFASDLNENSPYNPPVKLHFLCRKESNEKTLVRVSVTGIKGDKKYDDYTKNVIEGWKRALANLKSVSEDGEDLRTILGDGLFMGMY